MVEIPIGSQKLYRYEYRDGQTVYLGPVGSSPPISEEQFLAEAQLEKKKPGEVVVKTARGTPIRRGGRGYAIGKIMASKVYVHKKYVDQVIPEDIWEDAKKKMKDHDPKFKYNTVVYDTKDKSVRFDEAPDFDTAREPTPGKSVMVPRTGNPKDRSSKMIWHHKWMWVDDNYKGFDVSASKELSRRWVTKIGKQTASGHQKTWKEQLGKIGLS